MKKRILFVDLFCPHGHINLNKTYIRVLGEQGFSIDYVLKDGYQKDLGLRNDVTQWLLPEEYYNEKVGKIKARYNVFRILSYIKRNIGTEKYDHVFFSSYEEIALYLSGIKGNLILVNHANVAHLDNPVKRFFILKLAKYSTFIVYHDFIRNRCLEFEINKVYTEPMGKTEIYTMPGHPEKVLGEIHPRLVDPEVDHILFAPAGAKYGDGFLQELISDQNFISFLRKKRILFVIKDKVLVSSNDQFLVIDRYITDIQYQALFLKSRCVILSYPESFTYRVSAIMLECLSNHKPCLLSDIPGFRACESFFNYNPYFKTSEDLQHRILGVLSHKDNWFDKGISLEPRFEWLLS